MSNKNLMRSVGGLVLAPVILLSGCPQRCAPEPVPAPTLPTVTVTLPPATTAPTPPTAPPAATTTTAATPAPTTITGATTTTQAPTTTARATTTTATAPASTTTTVRPPPPSGGGGCTLAGLAFCEDFEGARNTTGNRNGDFSIARFSASRWRSEPSQDLNWIGRASIPDCRSGAAGDPLPPGDALICDPSGPIGTHYGLVSTAAQNYGDDLFRIAQPFDIADRTGTVTFDMSLFNEGQLAGWGMLQFTELPYSAPSYLDENSGGPTPAEGLSIHFNSSCGGRVSAKVRTYSANRETLVDDSSSCSGNITTRQGYLNRIQVKLSPTRIDIYASNYSSNGVDFGPLQLMFSAPIDLGFTRGNLYFGVHNHATEKYNGLPSWTVLWDNIAFDGPVVTPQRVYQVNDAATARGGGVELGYALPNSAGGGATPALSLGNVDLSGISSGRLLFNLHADQFANSNFSSWRVNYRFNGRTWRSAGLSADEIALIERAGSYTFSIPIELGDLNSGQNTVQLSGTGVAAGFGPYVGNIDLVLQ